MRKVKKPTDLGRFDEWGAYLRARVNAARRGVQASFRSLPLLDTEYGAVRSASYRYLRALKRANLIDEMKQHVRARRRSPIRGPKVSDAVWLLRLIEPDKGELLTAETRSRVAKELELALRHDIDPDIVLGFFAEIGSQDELFRHLDEKLVPGAAKRYRAR